jgi:hypothetical protein
MTRGKPRPSPHPPPPYKYRRSQPPRRLGPHLSKSAASPTTHTYPTPPRSHNPTGQIYRRTDRIVVFLDAGADGLVDYILHEFQMIWETHFPQTDPTFPCSFNRTLGALPTSAHMYLIDHSSLSMPVSSSGIRLEPPPRTVSRQTHTVAHPFILLDYVNIGRDVQ